MLLLFVFQFFIYVLFAVCCCERCWCAESVQNLIRWPERTHNGTDGGFVLQHVIVTFLFRLFVICCCVFIVLYVIVFLVCGMFIWFVLLSQLIYFILYYVFNLFIRFYFVFVTLLFVWWLFNVFSLLFMVVDCFSWWRSDGDPATVTWWWRSLWRSLALRRNHKSRTALVMRTWTRALRSRTRPLLSDANTFIGYEHFSWTRALLLNTSTSLWTRALLSDANSSLGREHFSRTWTTFV